MHFLQEAVLNFVYKLEEVDTALVVSFNESVKGSAEFTGDTDRLERFVEGLQAWGGTSLYDAIHYSLGRIKDQPGRKAVIVFSDGADTTSSMEDRDGRRLRPRGGGHGLQHRLQGLGHDGLEPARLPAQDRDARPAGSSSRPTRWASSSRSSTRSPSELKNHYLLAYTPKRAADGTWREIALKVNRPDAEVRVRKGYFAVKRGAGGLTRGAPGRRGGSRRRTRRRAARGPATRWTVRRPARM